MRDEADSTVLRTWREKDEQVVYRAHWRLLTDGRVQFRNDESTGWIPSSATVRHLERDTDVEEFGGKPPLPPIVTDVRAGRLYRHRNGNDYVVVTVGRIEATLEPVVVYRRNRMFPDPPLGEGESWVRPLSEFEDGRFAYVGDGHTC